MPVDEMTQAALMLQVAQGQAAKMAGGRIGSTLDRLDKQVVDGIMSKLEKGQGLLPQEAIQAWQQLFANARLRKALVRDERIGVSAAVAMKPKMDGEVK